MHASARHFLRAASASLLAAGLACMAPAPVQAGTSGVYLPPAPGGTGGEDSIETSTGTRCRQSMNSNGAYVDMGMTGTAGTPDKPGVFTYRDTREKEAMAYVRMTIPIGHRPERIDCSKIYELELDRLRREVELLRIGAK